MSTLYLVRHGQASFGQQDYDQLSDLGKQQSRWLGEYLAESDWVPELIIHGSLKRHHQTRDGIFEGLNQELEFKELSDWDEFDFKEIAYAYLRQHPEKAPVKHDARSFFALLKKALLAWSNDDINEQTSESWNHFRQRIESALELTLAHTQHSKILVVSSGGAISMALGCILDLPARSVIDLNLQTRNSGLTEVYFNKNKRYLSSFNTLPHLSSKERQSAISSA